MSTNSFFEVTRLKYMLIRQMSMNYKTLLIAAGAFAGIKIFQGTISMLLSNNTTYEPGLFMPFVFIGGFIFSSIIFSELNSPQKGYLYLTLPATTFEKLISAWLVSSVFYVLFSCIVIYAINLYFILFAASFTSKTIVVTNVFSPEVIKIFGVYIVTQSIFFLGAIYFRRSNFLKTILSLFVIVLIIIIFSSIMGNLLFKSSSVQFGWNGDLMAMSNYEYLAEHVVKPISQFVFWGCVTPFFLIVSYFRLKERQV